MGDLHIEEILCDAREERRMLPTSLTNGVFYVFYFLLLAVAAVFLVRVGILGVSRGLFYENRALANVNKEVFVPAPRGAIYDRFGKALATNEPSFSVSVKLSEYRENQSAINNFLYESIGIAPFEIESAIRDANIEESDLVIITSDLSQDEIIKLKAIEIPGLYVEDNFRRVYPYGDSFAHVVGYVDAENIGRSELEASYEDILRGLDGTLLRQYNARGDILDHRELRRPSAGDDLHTTLDADLQIYFEKRLKAGLAALGRTGGVGIAIDPRNGEILSLFSLPTFDANLFAGRGDESDQKQKAALLTQSTKPLFNRAVSGSYNPGSTIKPLVAVAALSENVISPQKKIFSKGYIELPNPYNPEQPSRFVDWAAHGWVDVRSSLARSANVYYYAVGGGFEDIAGLGIERLIKWWRIFGLGEETNVDLFGESKGFLPNPDEKEVRAGTIWRIGDTYNVSIGQGDLLVTPLQLVNYIEAIATGGTIYKPHLNSNVSAEVLRIVTGPHESFTEVQNGMRDAVRMPS